MLVAVETKKLEGSEQGTGTHPGDDRKRRACTCVRQPDQSARAERPIGAAARKSEDADRLFPAQSARSPRDPLYGSRRQTLTSAHHPNAARRIDPAILPPPH